MFESKTTYKNRYGDSYRWEPYTLENTYVFRMEGNSMEYCRCGGKEGQEKVDMSDLGMFDPSGGPYVALGTKIDGKEIVKISSLEGTFVVEVSVCPGVGKCKDEEKLTRIEIIGDNGREVVKYAPEGHYYRKLVQDDGQTVKFFVEKKNE